MTRWWFQPIASNKIVKIVKIVKKNHLPQIKGINVEKSLKPPPKCLLLRPFFWGRPRSLRVFPPVWRKILESSCCLGGGFLATTCGGRIALARSRIKRSFMCKTTRMEGQGVYNCRIYSNLSGWLLSSHISIYDYSLEGTFIYIYTCIHIFICIYTTYCRGVYRLIIPNNTWQVHHLGHLTWGNKWGLWVGFIWGVFKVKIKSSCI